LGFLPLANWVGVIRDGSARSKVQVAIFNPKCANRYVEVADNPVGINPANRTAVNTAAPGLKARY
jgi:hypothetical protein